MATLAPKLPYDHPFAGGYPRLGGQPLPTDPDAIDYLNRVAAADGAAVEVGVAMAVDDFFKGLKADGTFSAIKASCILCGARTISGALVPLAGTAPTPYNFASGDYDRSSGLKADGSTKYLDSNRANNADGLNDKHLSVYLSNGGTAQRALIGSLTRNPSVSVSQVFYQVGVGITGNLDTAINTSTPYGGSASFAGTSRSGSDVSVRASGATVSQTVATSGEHSYNHHVFARNDPEGTSPFHTDARLAFYSIGSAIADLSLLDNRVTNLVTEIAAAIP